MSESTPKSDAIRTTIAPWLNVRNGARAVDFYKAALGAIERFRLADDNGNVVAQLSVQGADFWLGDESPESSNFSPESLGGSTVRMVLTVEDPDALFARALAAGATEVWPVAEQNDWRVGRVADPFGHHWEIGKPLISGQET